MIFMLGVSSIIPLYVEASLNYDFSVAFKSDTMYVDWDDEEGLQVMALSSRSTVVTVNRPVATVRLHPNWGNNRPVEIVTRTRNREVGSLPRPARRSRNAQGNRPLFVDWFTTSATSGGRRVRSNTTVPNNANWNLHARWTNPNRHEDQWWQPAATGNTRINLRNFNSAFNSRWTTPMNNAIRGWNRSSARVEFNTNSTSNNRVRIPNVHPTRPTAGGRVLLEEVTGTDNSRLRRFSIELFSQPINSYVRNTPNATFTSVVESIMTHELAHVVGLRDNPTGVSHRNGSIMNTNRQRWIRVRPSDSDISNVNRIY